MTIHHHQSYHPTFVIDHVVLLYCVLFSESCSAEQTHPESGAEHQHGTERSYLVIFITCPITSRQHRASAERWSSLHFTSVTVHFSLTRVAVFHLRIMQSFPSIFFFTFMRWSNFIRVVSPNTTVTKTPLYIVIIATEDHFQEITSLPLLSFQKEFEVAFIKVFGVIHPRTLFIALWRKAVLPLWF